MHSSIFMAQFLVPVTWGLYAASLLLGCGAAIIWTGQGNYLTVNSNAETIDRNSGLFWVLFQANQLFGNLFVFFIFKSDTIEMGTIRLTYGTLAVVAVTGLLLMFTLGSSSSRRRNSLSEGANSVHSTPSRSGSGSGQDILSPASEESPPLPSSVAVIVPSPKDELIKSFKLLQTRRMILLAAMFIYTGIILSFYSGVYGPALGYTKAFGADSAKYIGISGMLIGLGEMTGGGLFGIFGKYTVTRGRAPIVLLAYVIHLGTFFLIFINIPAESSWMPVYTPAYIDSNLTLALFCSYLLGLGDSCFNTQIMTLLGTVYAENSAPAYAVFKFIQSMAAAVAFLYSNWINLHVQLLILGLSATVGTLTFAAVEFEARALAKRTTRESQYPSSGQVTSGSTPTTEIGRPDSKSPDREKNGALKSPSMAPSPAPRSVLSSTGNHSANGSPGLVSQNPLVSEKDAQKMV